MSDTSVVQREAKPVDIVRAALERMRPQLAMALPRHLTADRLLRVAMTAIQTTPKLLECDRTSLYRAVMTAAQLGLEPDGILGQGFLVPYGRQVQFIPGYKGLITLARNSGDVATIVAREVCENDEFEYDQASGDPPRHPFSFTAERGEVIGFYALAKFKDGAFQCELMTRREVEAIRDKSQGYRYAMKKARELNKEPDTPWHNAFVEMGKKSCVRRLSKYLPMSVQKAAAISDSYDTGRHAVIDTHGDLVIEGESHEVEETSGAVENKPNKLDQFEEKHGEQTGNVVNINAPETVAETGGHAEWIENFNSLGPKKNGNTIDWYTYVEGVEYMLSQASKDDLNTLQVSKHNNLKRLREEDGELYHRVTDAIAKRSKELTSDAGK